MAISTTSTEAELESNEEEEDLMGDPLPLVRKPKPLTADGAAALVGKTVH